jgi:hypothetical protein
MKKLEFFGTAVLFIGMLLVFLPHTLHGSFGLGTFSHTFHMGLGISLVIAGLLIIIASKKKAVSNKAKKKAKKMMDSN